MSDEEESTMIIEGNERLPAEQGSSSVPDKEREICHCTYRYGNEQLELAYHSAAHRWDILSVQSVHTADQLEPLNGFLAQFDSIEHLSFDQQIQLIIKKFDQFFSGSPPPPPSLLLSNLRSI